MYNNEYEKYVVECFQKSDIFLKLKEIFQNKSVNAEQEWILSQIGYDDQCKRIFFVGDLNLFIYGGTQMQFKNDKRVIKAERKMGNNMPPFIFEYAPCIYMSYTDREYLYPPITDFRAGNGTVLVKVRRVVELWTEVIRDMLVETGKCIVGDVRFVSYNDRGYFCFDYSVPNLNWKSWF